MSRNQPYNFKCEVTDCIAICKPNYYMIEVTPDSIFASQGLRSALLIFTHGIISRIFVIPAHCHLLYFDSYAPCNDVIFS